MGIKDEELITEPLPLPRILREVLRHYTEYRGLVKEDGRNHVIDYSYWVHDDDGNRRNKENVSISFWDLYRGLSELAPRKREAIFYNVILDLKQRDVAEKMKITTVSVGQYVEAGMMQLSKTYFYDEYLHKGTEEKVVL